MRNAYRAWCSRLFAVFANRVDVLRDHRPPTWLVALLSLRPSPIPVKPALRAVLVLALPLAVGLAAGSPGLGAAASLGGLPMVLADEGGPYRRRAFQLGAAALAATVGLAIGMLTLPVPLLATPVLVLMAPVSVVVARLAEASRISGMLLLTFAVIGAAKAVPGSGFWAVMGAFVAGVLWSLAVGLAGWTVRGSAHEREAVARVFVQMAAMLGAESKLVRWAARQQLTVALNTAYDQLLEARTWVPSRDADYRRLLALLSQATLAAESAVAVVTSGERAPQLVIDQLTQVAAAVRAGAPVPSPPPRPAPLDGSHVTQLYDGLAKLDSGAPRELPPPRSAGEWARERFDEISGDRLTVNAMLRIGGCVALAEMIGLVLPVENTHWITLTVAIVLRPELGSVFGRTALRGLGTVLGVLMAASVLVAEPPGWVLVLLVAVFAAAAAIGKAYSYGLLSAALTPILIIKLDIQNLGDSAVLIDRLTHTIIGCIIVLVFGYWLWPGSLRPRVGGRVAKTLSDCREYVARGLGSDADLDATTAARRRAYRSLTELRTAFAQVAVEPSAAGRQAAAWWPAIAGLEQALDAVTELVVRVRNGQAAVEKQQVEAVLDVLDELADAVRDDRNPCYIQVGDCGELTEIVDRLHCVLEGIRGPELR